MRDKLHNDEFENYLQTEVKNHRMYASDSVWRNIQNTLHVEKSWHALTFVSIFIIAALTAGTLLVKPNTNLLKSEYHPATQITFAVSEKENKVSTEILRQHLLAENLTKQTISEAASNIALEEHKNAPQPSPYISYNIDNGAVAMIAAEPNQKYSGKINIDNSATNIYQSKKEEEKRTQEIKNISTNPLGAYSSFSFMQPLVPQKKGLLFINSFSPKNNFAFRSNKNFAGYLLSLPSYSNDNHKTSRWNYQVYATPSISYRRLYDITTKHSPATFISALPFNSNGYIVDVNKSVKHKPGLGFEAGFALGYKLTPQLILRTGLEFNMRQYTIETSDHLSQNPELSNVASFDTSNLNFTNRILVNNNIAFDLNDKYYEISLPLGLDWRAVSLKKISFGVAGSIQPTYTFAKQPFVITSDLKTYADGSSLMRNWNINTTFETYFAYKLGSYMWQIGPQFRYQQLPTFNTQYPVREHLLDYGLKIGLTKSIK